MVTGAHRSGTTWVGRMLASHPQVRYFSEPFNPERPGCPVRHYFHYMTEEEEPQFDFYLRHSLELRYPWLDRVKTSCWPAGIVTETLRAAWCAAGRFLGDRPLVKDPMALLCAEWLAQRYQPDMIVLIRHPAAFAGSLKRLNWHFPFDHLLNQSRLIEDYLESFRDPIERFARTPPDIVTQAVLLWRILHFTILRYRLKHPDWIFVRHEDLSARPQQQFGKLFQAIGLDFSGRARRTIEEHTHPKNPAEAEHGAVHQLKRDSLGNIWNWTQRLRPEEIVRIRKGTEDTAHHFYADADWSPPVAAKAEAA